MRLDVLLNNINLLLINQYNEKNLLYNYRLYVNKIIHNFVNLYVLGIKDRQLFKNIIIITTIFKLNQLQNV